MADLQSVYMAGVIDSSKSISIRVQKRSSQTNFGYVIEPIFMLTTENEMLLKLADDWMELNDIDRRHNKSESSYNITITKRDELIVLLETVHPYLMVYDEAVTILLDDIIPALRDGKHTKKDGFVDLMVDVERFYRSAGRESPKYDREYFVELWNDDLSGTV